MGYIVACVWFMAAGIVAFIPVMIMAESEGDESQCGK